MNTIKKAAILGGGLIGGGWLARLIENGVEVSVFDPDRQAERKLSEVLANAERAYARLTMAPRGAMVSLAYARSALARTSLSLRSACRSGSKTDTSTPFSIRRASQPPPMRPPPRMAAFLMVFMGSISL